MKSDIYGKMQLYTRSNCLKLLLKVSHSWNHSHWIEVLVTESTVSHNNSFPILANFLSV